jgi:hypothetical protein
LLAIFLRPGLAGEKHFDGLAGHLTSTAFATA